MRAAALLSGFTQGATIRRDRELQAQELQERRLDREALRGAAAAPAGGGDGSFTLDGASADAPSLIRSFEGFQSKPYYDVNAYRVGYGSDTVTRADGTVQRVTPGMTVTRADADRDLARRTADFQRKARTEIGANVWDTMPAPAAAALTSIAYNYGHVPDRIEGAARSGDPAALAAAVEGLGSDNDGINRKRRAREAGIIRSAPAWGALASHYAAATGA